MLLHILLYHTDLSAKLLNKLLYHSDFSGKQLSKESYHTHIPTKLIIKLLEPILSAKLLSKLIIPTGCSVIDYNPNLTAELLNK